MRNGVEMGKFEWFFMNRQNQNLFENIMTKVKPFGYWKQ